ncbi:Mov34/MPN/PAD-1 family protein [Hymenobacter sp. HSC-4F20]|nr:Mov34/MPN/PAD-1 family protein [Hymenobacter sp. HSC-4F20]
MHHPLETGGILLGYYDSDYRVATIVVATPPPSDSEHGRYRFIRGTKGIKQLLTSAKNQNPPLYYVGEWHTHPNSAAQPSSTDIKQMRYFALRRLYGSGSPLLLVIGGTPPHELLWQAVVTTQRNPPSHLTMF